MQSNWVHLIKYYTFFLLYYTHLLHQSQLDCKINKYFTFISLLLKWKYKDNVKIVPKCNTWEYILSYFPSLLLLLKWDYWMWLNAFTWVLYLSIVLGYLRLLLYLIISIFWYIILQLDYILEANTVLFLTLVY